MNEDNKLKETKQDAKRYTYMKDHIQKARADRSPPKSTGLEEFFYDTIRFATDKGNLTEKESLELQNSSGGKLVK